MVGPAFAASLIAAAATLMPFPAGAYDQIPSVLSDSGLNPSVISPYTGFPTAAQYAAEVLRNAVITGCLCASIPMLKYLPELNETEVQEVAETS